jgi:hypothetical protein
MAGWQANLLKIVPVVFLIFSPIVYLSWPASYSLYWAYALVICIVIIPSGLIACPFVTQDKAKRNARKFAEENLHGATSIQIDRAELNDWTWIVGGWRIQTYTAPMRFWVNVHAKTGTASNLRWLK